MAPVVFTITVNCCSILSYDEITLRQDDALTFTYYNGVLSLSVYSHILTQSNINKMGLWLKNEIYDNLFIGVCVCVCVCVCV